MLHTIFLILSIPQRTSPCHPNHYSFKLPINPNIKEITSHHVPSRPIIEFPNILLLRGDLSRYFINHDISIMVSHCLGSLAETSQHGADFLAASEGSVVTLDSKDRVGGEEGGRVGNVACVNEVEVAGC